MARNVGTVDSVPPAVLTGTPRGRAAKARGGERVWAWTRSALRDLAYAVAVFVWSIVAFAILVTGVSVTGESAARSELCRNADHER